MQKLYKSIGLMSGTSFDGVDVGMIISDGYDHVLPLETMFVEYSKQDRAQIEAVVNGEYSKIWHVERDLSIFHAECVQHFLQKNRIPAKEIDLIGFHGQAIYHAPERQITVQLGNPHLIEAKTSITTIGDFRRRNVAFGGQGAPLVPIFLKAISSKLSEALFLNIGGVSNVCYIKGNEVSAFDICFGNAPLNDLCQRKIGTAFDDDGELARSGTVDKPLVHNFLEHEYFKKSFPKSLDRNQFNFSKFEQLSLPDALATLTEIIALSLKMSFVDLHCRPQVIYLSGGGLKNSFMVEKIQQICGVKVLSTAELGYDPDFVESYAFAYLAIRKHLELPISYVSTTGAIW